MSSANSELPGCTFNIDEVSPNVYRAIGWDRAGRTVEMTGTDPDAILQRCRQAAFKKIVRTH